MEARLTTTTVENDSREAAFSMPTASVQLRKLPDNLETFRAEVLYRHLQQNGHVCTVSDAAEALRAVGRIDLAYEALSVAFPKRTSWMTRVVRCFRGSWGLSAC